MRWGRRDATGGFAFSFPTLSQTDGPPLPPTHLTQAVGAAAGAFGSVVGVGGGVLIVPAIVNACP